MTSGGNEEGSCKQCGGWSHGVDYRWSGLCMSCASKKKEQDPSEKCCPICGSEEYKEIRKSNGILGPGGHSVLQYCICKGCSIMFKDPNVFFKRTIQ